MLGDMDVREFLSPVGKEILSSLDGLVFLFLLVEDFGGFLLYFVVCGKLGSILFDFCFYLCDGFLFVFLLCEQSWFLKDLREEVVALLPLSFCLCVGFLVAEELVESLGGFSLFF